MSVFLCVPAPPCPQRPIQVPPCSCLVHTCRPACADPEQGLGLQTPTDTRVAAMSTSTGSRPLYEDWPQPGASMGAPPPESCPIACPLPGVLSLSLSPGTPVPLGEGLAPNGHPHPVALGPGVPGWEKQPAHTAVSTSRATSWPRARPGPGSLQAGRRYRDAIKARSSRRAVLPGEPDVRLTGRGCQGWPLGGGRGPPGRQRAACFQPGFRGVSTRPHREGAGPGEGARGRRRGGRHKWPQSCGRGECAEERL